MCVCVCVCVNLFIWAAYEQLIQVILFCFPESRAETAECFGPSLGKECQQMPAALVRRLLYLQGERQVHSNTGINV